MRELKSNKYLIESINYKINFSDVVKLEDGIGEKLATFVFYQASFLSSIIMALTKGWKLALLCLISFPVTLSLVGIAALVSLLTYINNFKQAYIK